MRGKPPIDINTTTLEHLNQSEFSDLLSFVFSHTFARSSMLSINWIKSTKYGGFGHTYFSLTSIPIVPNEFRIGIDIIQFNNRISGFDELKEIILQTCVSSVDRILIVSNSEFDQTISGSLQMFGDKLNIPICIVDGPMILKMFKGIVEPKSLKTIFPPSHINVEVGITNTPEIPEAISRGELYVNYDDIPYITIVLSTDSRILLPVKLLVKSKLLQADITINTAVNNHSRVFHSIPISNVKQELIDINSSFEFTSDSIYPTSFDVECHGTIRFKPVYIHPITITSQMSVIQNLKKAENKWLTNGDPQFVLLLSFPGIGKSFQLNESRIRIIGKGVSVLHISADVTQTADALFNKIVSFIFPNRINEEVELNVEKLEMKKFLRLAKYSEEEIDHLTNLIFYPKKFKKKNVINDSHANLLAAIIINYIKDYKLSIIVDDITKLDPTAKIILFRIQTILYHGRHNNIFMLLSARVTSENQINDYRENHPTFETLVLPKPDTQDALQMLKSTLPNVDPKILSEFILPQIPKTPFALKEAVAFLEEEEVIERISSKGQFRLLKDTGLLKKIKSDKLSNATIHRYGKIIKKFKRQQKDWLDDFLLAGAILGRRFSISFIAKALNLSDQQLSAKIITILLNKDILSLSSNMVSYLEFSHDLIRDAILDYNQPGRKAAASLIASKLSGAVNSDQYAGNLSEYTEGIIEVLSGNLERGKDRFGSFAVKCSQEGKQLDAGYAHLMLIQLMSPTHFYDIQHNTRLWQLIFWDSALEKLYVPNLNIVLIQPELLLKLCECLECFITAGLGIEVGLEYLITEARVLAEQVADKVLQAKVEYIYGRILFESKDDFIKSLDYHTYAYKALIHDEQNQDLVIKNLSRMFLCQRQLGKVEEAKETLTVFKNYISGDQVLKAKLITYQGYLLFYSDLRTCYANWVKALDLVDKQKDLDRIVQYSIGSGYAALLLDDLDKSAELLAKAEQLINKLQRYSNKVRLLLNKSCLLLIKQEYRNAIECIRDGEFLALKYGVFRRLWRVEAMRATCEELMGNMDSSYEYDIRVMKNLLARIESEKHLGEEAPWIKQRHVLPVINMLLRGHDSLLNDIPVEQLQKVKSFIPLIKRKKSAALPNELAYHIKEVKNGVYRAIVTE